MDDNTNTETSPRQSMEERVLANTTPYPTTRPTAEEKQNQAEMKDYFKALQSNNLGKHLHEIPDDGTFDGAVTWCTTAKRWLPPKTYEENCVYYSGTLVGTATQQ